MGLSSVIRPLLGCVHVLVIYTTPCRHPREEPGETIAVKSVRRRNEPAVRWIYVAII